MKVTDKQISMHPKLKDKLDLMIDRMEKRGFDNFIIVDGKEGFGKTTLATQLCYYVSHETGRKFSHEQVYFRVSKMLEIMKKERAQIFLLDEAELDLLSEQRGKMQRYFMQMLMAARKKNHFIVAIIPTIKKLKSFVVDRAIGFIRVYSPDNLSRGYYAYYREEAKDALYRTWQRTKRLNYRKYYTFNGTFPNTQGKLIDEDLYDKKKDAAISSIGTEEKDENIYMRRYNVLKYVFKKMHENKEIDLTLDQIAKRVGQSARAVSNWSKLAKEKPYISEMTDF